MMARRNQTPENKAFHPVLLRYFSYCFIKSAMRLKNGLDEQFSVFGVAGPQFGILAILKADGMLTQIQLGSYLMTDRATMVKLIDGLEKKGLVIRKADARDRRVNRLAISPRGRRVLARLESARRRVEKSFLGVLSKSQALQIAQSLFELASRTKLP